MSEVASELRWRWSHHLELVLQSEAAECGLACLVMIARYHGYRTDLGTLRRRFQLSLKGATLKSLIDIATALEFGARPITLDVPYLKDLSVPCILHWDMRHFVVLKSMSRRGAVIFDPAIGKRFVPLDELAKHFTGVALELLPTTRFEPRKEEQRFRVSELLGRVSGLRRGLAQVLLLSLALEVFAIASPLYIQWIVDHAIVSGDRDLITVLGIGFGLLVIINAAVAGFRAWVIAVLSTNLNFQWLGNVFAHLMRLPMDYFEKRHLGDIVSRFNSVSVIQRQITRDFVQTIVDGIMVIGMLLMMFLYSIPLTVITLLTVCLYAAVRGFMYRPLRDANAEHIIQGAKQQTHFLESARGMQAIRLFGRKDERRIGWMNMLADQFNAEFRINRLSITNHTLSRLFFGVERVLIIWLAAVAVVRRDFTVGMLFAFLAYKEQFSGRVSGLIDKLFEFRLLRVHGERIADIVLTPGEPDSGAEPSRERNLSCDLEVRNVTFQYSTTDANVLEDVSLQVKAGEFVAITGVSGAGKTTLAKLVLGLLRPSSGEILIGGLPIDHVGLAEYREQIAAVMQDDVLFSGTIEENISFFDTQSREDHIETCAKLAAIHEEIMAMPMRYNTLIGDIGTGLSGGQKQRLLLARALYKNPRILVLDEATSHLDQHNERRVAESLRQLKLSRIVIAHRQETIAMADRVLDLVGGHLTERSTAAIGQSIIAINAHIREGDM